MSQKIILWSVATEPLFLAAVAWFLRRTGSLPPAGTVKAAEPALLAFAAISLSLIWAGHQFASGRFTPKTPGTERDRPATPLGQMIIAVALSAGPGVLGFAHYLVYGVDWVLPVFNLGAFALAARHVLNFSAERR
jgi:hypothetical protein